VKIVRKFRIRTIYAPYVFLSLQIYLVSKKWSDVRKYDTAS